MRIPTSLIVMSVVTAIPFGLAIRDTASGGGRRLTKAEREAAEQQAAEAAYRAKMEDEELQADREARERRDAALARLPTVFGSERATIGTVFEKLRLGETPDSYDELEDFATDNMMRLDVQTDEDEHVSRVSVTLGGDDSVCDALRAKLIAAWGPPTNSVWLAADGMQRARLSGCELSVEPTLPPAQWLAAVDLYGRPEAALEEAPLRYDSDLGSHFRVPGLGFGSGRTVVTAATDRGKVAWIYAELSTDFDTSVALREVISARMKTRPVRDDETGDDVWEKAPTARLHVNAETSEAWFSIGKEPVW